MDDLLLAVPKEKLLLSAFGNLQDTLGLAGLQLAPEKVQKEFQYHYPGHRLLHNRGHPQKVSLCLDTPQTLNDFQKLLGDVNWITSSLKITTGQLKPLFDILQWDSDPNSPRVLTKAGWECMHLIEKALEGAHLDYIDYAKPLKLLVFCSAHAPTGVFWQESPILWVHS